MRYEINDGRVLTWSLETHVVDHCNLRCEHCCTLSPALPAWCQDPDDLARDLARAARVLRPSLFKLTGGEPLLHPDLMGCIAAVRASGIAQQLSITTNGFLLQRMPDALFAAIDRLTLSHYASAPLPQRALAEVVERCTAHGVVLTLKRIDRFQRLDAAPPLSATVALDVYRSCWLKLRCHLLYRGRFYACTRPPHLAARLAQSQLAWRDGVDLAGDDLLGRLVAYLESERPLESCRRCLGASGGFEAHRQLQPAQTARA